MPLGAGGHRRKLLLTCVVRGAARDRRGWRLARGRKKCCQVSRELLDARRRKGTVGVEPLGERPTVKKEMAAEGLGPQEREVGLREAESASNRDPIMAALIEHVADSGDLSLEPVDELGGIAPPDQEPRRPEPGGADLDLALPVFGVDDPDAGRCDGEVVDISAATRHAAVVPRDDAVRVGSNHQRVSDRPFGKRTLVEGGFMLRRVLEGEKQSADAGVSLPRALFAIAPTALVLAHQARPGIAQLKRGLSRHRRRAAPSRHGVQGWCAPPGPTTQLCRRPVCHHRSRMRRLDGSRVCGRAPPQDRLHRR